MAVMQQANIQQAQVIFVHMETTNKSFIDMHYYLKERGIKNNNFFLALYDSGLRGVDPRDPNLPNYMKIRILKECKKNYWYFLREVVRIPESGGAVGSGTRYRLNRGNLAMNFLFTINASFYLEEPRQYGKTVGALCRYLWVYNFATSNSQIMFMHKDHSGSKDNLKSLRNIRDTLPSYLKFDSAVGVDGKKLKVPNTIEKMQHPYNGNTIITKPSARTKDAANNLGRGATIPLQFYDEFAFMPFNEEVYMAATPAYSTASQNAKKNHAPYGIVITSTPGDLLTDCGSYAYTEIRNKATPFREDFYDMTYEQIDGIRQANRQSDLFLVVYNYKQLGGGQEYLDRMIKLMNANWPKIRREVLLEWAESPTQCPFTQEDLDIIKGYCHDPIKQINFGKFGQYVFNIYDNLDMSYPPIIGVDVSGATFGDSSTIVVIDSHTTKVCAALNCNYIPADDLAEVIYQLVSIYMPNAVINIETNGGFGAAVVQRLCKTSVKKNLYWEIKEKVIEESFNGYRMEKRPRKVKAYGLNTNKNIRARLIEILQERVAYHKDKFICPIIWDEMRSMEVKKSGKVEHSDKTHDDTVFGYLMALYVWYEGKNLVENFGIRKNSLRTDQDLELEENFFEDAIEKKAKIQVDNNTLPEDRDEIQETLEWVEKSVGLKTGKDMYNDQFVDRLINRNNMIATYPTINNTFINQYGVNVSPNQAAAGHTQFNIPDELFNPELDFMDDTDDFGNQGSFSTSKTPLAGNLAQYYDLL